ncbi:SDR family NAD(P)-dependent oxidoreductase [Ferruginibacter albus]|uniref:SDR family NAD(P)-dependent oxidoreductase n=1 Tax=Ferruginibacter albus TaxID=2875540 RepID=UPI001CC33E6C|nr:SDR family NAD(P)-dependent oxidoreductase [Ferruginibacter albus]UAY51746.1 SDR family NAD(P)-dependent oxidoreductase [Ferruginibacter albus]
MNKIVVITGATSGIGEACARKFAADGDNIIITGRRSERLNQLKQQLEKEFAIKVVALNFDVQNKEEVSAAFLTLPENWKAIDILINNAGLALGRDYFDEADMNDWETMLNTNVHGLLYVSRAILQFMITRKIGHIINISSTAGKNVYEKGNIYCATKHAVAAISQSMRIDLLRHNIKITDIFPGAVQTEFSNVRFKGDDKKAREVYEGITPLSATDVANSIFYCTSLPPHVCINELVLTCTQQADSFYMYKNQ